MTIELLILTSSYLFCFKNKYTNNRNNFIAVCDFNFFYYYLRNTNLYFIKMLLCILVLTIGTHLQLKYSVVCMYNIQYFSLIFNLLAIFSIHLFSTPHYFILPKMGSYFYPLCSKLNIVRKNAENMEIGF